MTHATALPLLMLFFVGCSGGESSPMAALEAQPATRAPVGDEEPEGPEPLEPSEPLEAEGAGDSPAPAPLSRVVFFMGDGAPDPLACVVDADCTNSGVVNDEGCCWSYQEMNAVAMSAAYRAWQTAHQEAECADVTCPPPPAPTRPPRCLFDVSCVEAKCQNACLRR